MRYRSKRIYVWSPSIAYSVGLIASDGCLQKDGRHVDLTSKDIPQLVSFNKAIGRELRISQKKNGAGKVSYRVQFSDVAYYDFLARCGLTSNKSRTMCRLSIPDEYFYDFLRGLFDGDGSCYGYRDLRWKSSYMFYITFASTSRPFLEYIQQENTRLLGTGSGSIRTGKGVLSLCYAKSDSRKLFSAMYSDETSLRLERKFTKLQGFTNNSFDGTIIQASLRAGGEIGKHASLRG